MGMDGMWEIECCVIGSVGIAGIAWACRKVHALCEDVIVRMSKRDKRDKRDKGDKRDKRNNEGKKGRKKK